MKLNKEQKIAAEHLGSHVMLLAGAGTGKTRTLVGRVIHLVKSGVAPSRILVMTFTRKAAKEMKERLAAEMGQIAQEVIAGTFHYFCLTVMRKMPAAFGMEDSSVIDRDDQISLMKMARAPFAEKDSNFPTPRMLVDWLSYARNTNSSIKKYLAEYTDNDEFVIETILKVFAGYQERKKKGKYLDFDDILYIFAKRIGEEPRIREQLQGVFDHILVDETQDNNRLQHIIIENLIGGDATLFSVGDDAQSIYAFRGADFHSVHSFTDRIPNSKVLKLVENYRSTQEILDLANWLLSESEIEYDKELSGVRGLGVKPKLIDFSSEMQEARWIAEDLIRRYEDTERWKDHMVLTRTAWGARALEAMLVERKVPYVFIGGTSLMAAAHVKDLMALLRVAYSHYDELSWIRYLTMWPGIGSVGAQKAVDEILGVATFEEAVAIVEKRFAKQPQVAKCVQEIREAVDCPPVAVSQATKLLSELLKKKYDRWDRRAKDLVLLAKLAKEHGNLKAFLEAYTLDPISNASAEHLEEEDCVTVITVHSAKGTEKPVCYLLGAQAGSFPHSRSIGEADKEEEERRLLYVAITRAMNELVITRSHAGSNTYQGASFGQATKPQNEYFLADVPDHLVDTEVHGFSEGGRGGFGGLKDFRP